MTAPMLGRLARLVKRLRQGRRSRRLQVQPLPLLAERCIGAQMHVLHSCVQNEAQVLPGTLVVRAGAYAVEGQVYDMSLPGVYRFHRTGGETMQRLVRGESALQTLEAIVWLHRYGNRDETQPLHRLGDIARSRPLHVLCGRAVRLAVDVLRECGFEARLGMTLALDGWNAFDNGHTWLEVNDGAGWTACDLTYRCWFRRGEQRLNLLALTDALRLGQFVDSVSLGGGSLLGAFDRGGPDLSLDVERRAMSQEARESWYKRITNLCLIEAAGRMHAAVECPADGDVAARYFESFGSAAPVAVERLEFESRFYGVAR